MFNLKNATMLTRAQQKNVKGGEDYAYAFCDDYHPCVRPGSYCKNGICYTSGTGTGGTGGGNDGMPVGAGLNP